MSRPICSQPKNCNDSYVLSLVAYYQVKDNLAIWCQPSGTPCPTRIARYQIKSGLENTKSLTTGQPYTDFKDEQKKDKAYNPLFDITKPEQNVTTKAADFDEPPPVLVNYIDHTPKQLSGNECTAALGNPTVTSGGGEQPQSEKTL